MIDRGHSFPIRMDPPHVWRSLELEGMRFPGLPNLLLSATYYLNSLRLNIPHTGYISPDAMGTALSALTSLKSFRLLIPIFSFSPGPGKPTVRLPRHALFLPVLRDFEFRGVSEYLDDLVAHIDAPQLNKLETTFLKNNVYNTPQLIQFISRSPIPSELEFADITLWDTTARLNFSSSSPDHGERKIMNLLISWGGMNQLASSLEQIFSSCLPPLSMLKELYIYEFPNRRENSLWLEVSHLFTSVKNIHLC
jgi:hypothetical protein